VARGLVGDARPLHRLIERAPKRAPAGAARLCHGPVEEAAWAFARLRALHYAVLLMLYADTVGDAAMLREARVGLANALVEE